MSLDLGHDMGGLVGFEVGVVWSDSPLEVSTVASLFGGGRPCRRADILFDSSHMADGGTSSSTIISSW